MGSNFIVLIAMFVMMYFLLIKPQKTQAENRRKMIASLAQDDIISTIGGIKGRIVMVMDDSLILEIAENVQIELAKNGVAHVITEDDEDLDEEADEEIEDTQEDNEESL